MATTEAGPAPGTTILGARKGRTRKSVHAAGKVAANIVLGVIGLAFLVPLLWVVTTSVGEGQTLKVTWPEHFTGTNFAHVTTVDILFRPLLNGLILCGGGTLVTVVVAILAAYPLSRYKSRLKRPFLLTILFTTGLPITAIMIPVYAMFTQLNLIDQMWSATIFMGSTALPFGIWLMKNFMDGVPVELEEVAWTDGASSMATLRRIVLPLMWPGVIVVTIFTFIGMWGNFFVPFILLIDPNQLPASVSIFTFFDPQHGGVQYGQLAAFSILYCVPVAVLYLVMSRRLSGSFALGGALKG
ncbi:MAG TPA: carbohydrate ABC transporter permease [Actinocatenispora sp.]